MCVSRSVMLSPLANTTNSCLCKAFPLAPRTSPSVAFVCTSSTLSFRATAAGGTLRTSTLLSTQYCWERKQRSLFLQGTSSRQCKSSTRHSGQGISVTSAAQTQLRLD
eukprot:1765663-Rhodomonas_salina.1